jgi:hypothetical protein
MAVFSGGVLSGSANGRPIPVVATATAGTLIHTAVTGTTSFDELYVWASNVTAIAATLTIEWGGVTDPGDHLTKAYNIPANSLPIPIALGQRAQGGVVIRAFSGTASALNITGYYNRVQQ